MTAQLDNGSRTGWLFNYHPTTLQTDGSGSSRPGGGNQQGSEEGPSSGTAALVLLFQDHAGETFFVPLVYTPYILLQAQEGHESEVELGLMSMFGPALIFQMVHIEKEDLDLVNHLSGRKRRYLKIVFNNVQNLTLVRGRLDKIVKRNAAISVENPFAGDAQCNILNPVRTHSLFDDDYFHKPVGAAAGTDGDANSLRWTDWVQDMREYDVKYHMRVAIDEKIYVGLWYDITVKEGETTITRCDDSAYAPAMPRVVAFDIETTKAPLKFPQPEVDQIYMISYMLDGRGYLIVNRDIVTADISPFEYTPKPEYEGHFDTFNEVDEAATLRRFFDEMKKYRPNVYVTYNGDYFDFPFIHARALSHGMNMRNEIGFVQMADGAFLNQQIPHLDCFYWVKRDSYLPQGSQGLKAVTKYKLGYNPIEVDPEDMLPLAQNEPQKMASYSVSDAVSTWYLYMKYVHPFIFSLATIIPMSPDDVLRKGSGGLCESLLMVQAEANNVVFPNKKEMVREKFHDGHLIDSETYIGGRVEALKSGVYRADVPMWFHMNPETYQGLIDDVDNALRFTLEVENEVKVEEVTNYDEIRAAVVQQLTGLRDHPRQQEKPLIYHLDVGAMYPNIILTNRLQPYAIPSADVCAGCCFNTPDNKFQCKRPMSWKWRGELFTAGRYEYQRVKAQLENESFAASVIEQTQLASVQKKTYGNRKGNVLEGTSFERKNTWKKGDNKFGGGTSGYRQESKKQQREAAENLLRKEFGSDDDGSDDDNENGLHAFHKLNENTQFNMLKKRLSEYSRKAYGKIHESREVMRSNVVCQRENSFYVDTVRLFRDRRYEYKVALKNWKKKLDAAKDMEEIKMCQSRCVQMESLQLAHKCILNSFYGYVMRKGSRWSSMEMAGIVTYCGASLIQIARALVQQVGVTLELDTDGIWCCLPCTFPENFTLTTNNPKKPKISISYPCVVLNKMVHDRYTNHQYQDLESPGVYKTHSENSIYFEVDGPYLAMLLPASREEGKSIKKRYAVFNKDGSLAELKGFELKRRGELMLIKDFQSQVFRRFLDGESLADAYASAAVVANTALDLLESKGEGYDTEEILEKITESSNMARRLSEYPETQKSLAITTARRIAEFLGPQMVKDKGLACHFIISRLPAGRPVTERAVPTTIFRAEPAVRTHFLRKWTGDTALPADALDFKALLDWDYYTARFNGCVQKIITIPAALQQVPNPVPRVLHPEWLEKKIRQQTSGFRQVSLMGMLTSKKAKAAEASVVVDEEGEGTADGAVQQAPGPGGVADMEDFGGGGDIGLGSKRGKKGSRPDHEEDSDWENEVASVESTNAEEQERLRREQQLLEEEARIRSLTKLYFQPKSTTALDTAFFTHEGTKSWLTRQRQQWIHRAQLRKQLAAGDEELPQASGVMGGANPQAGNALSSHFIDLKSRALSSTWHVLEVRQSVEDPGMLLVIAALEKNLCVYRVEVPRHVIVNASKSLELPPSIQVVELASRVLPRHQSAERLFQVEIPPGQEGEQLLNELSIDENVRQIYEAHLTREEQFIESVGCCLNVRSQVHVANSKRRPPHLRDVFHMSELETAGSSNYAGSLPDRCVFLYHSIQDTRGLVALISRRTNEALLVFIQPAAAARPSVNAAALCEEAARHLQTQDAPLQVQMEVAAEHGAAWRLVSQKLTELMESGQAPLVAVLQSAAPTQQLLQQRLLPAQLPYLRTLGALEDEKLFTDPFRWARRIAQRMLQRYYACGLWVDERLSWSRLANVPLCNIAQDSCVHVLDVLYSRALHRRGHVLWNSAEPSIAYDTIEERPREVVVAGGYTSWCMELSLSRLDAVAILFSQMIQEGDDPNSHLLCDRGVASHFNILRDLVADLLGQAVVNSFADVLMTNLTRWLRDPVSRCYEPRLVEMLSSLSHRALTAVLVRLAKLGGRTIKVDASAITIVTPKYTVADVVSFGRFLTSSLQDQPMMILLSIAPVRYWCPLIVLDQRNYAGLYIDAEAAIAFKEDEEPSLHDLTLEQYLTLDASQSRFVADVLRRRVQTTLRELRRCVLAVHDEVCHDPAVTLASKNEQMLQRLGRAVQHLLERQIQTELMDEVQRVLDSKELFTAEEAAQISAHGTVPSATTVAIEYSKCVCRLLNLIPSEGVMGRVKNNCMRLCGLSPFAPAVRQVADPYLSSRVQTITCGFCNNQVHIDLGEKRSGGQAFACPQCHAPIAAPSVEARLVRQVNMALVRHNHQDFVCSKCGQIASSLVADTCCGALVGKDPSIVGELQALRHFSEVQNFTRLRECVSSALQSV
ncbi:DNA polymerase epsilon catalytic subunit [Strigomonas culicis]|uniref:DNA polymerase epsilon catalytic subunit n=1 Tax=Strigomonas culicis TaxID=28005 RepID=S9TXL4_9TRYP|nr:DNA polymerase epsilon catalytic subunit [Strigomonas culicis]|eukprot:EPY23237.1 DNA polymerase epsilon catalytic subunit [Strigomonas culicis]